MIDDFILNFPATKIQTVLAIHADCMDWLDKAPENSIHAVVTDPPYGLREFEDKHIDKVKEGDGDAVWQTFRYADGAERAVQPCFSTLSDKERSDLYEFFELIGTKINRVLMPAGNLIIAGHVSLTDIMYPALAAGGLQFRGSVIRMTATLRGGDRPPGAQKEFPDVCTLPRSLHEPWGLFRKPIPKGMSSVDCLRTYGTGGYRRESDARPFMDVIKDSTKPTKDEVKIMGHPNLKPQILMRPLIHAALPLGKGIVLDPFMGSGSALGAALFLGYECIGIERDDKFYADAVKAIPAFALEKPNHDPYKQPTVFGFEEEVPAEKQRSLLD